MNKLIKLAVFALVLGSTAVPMAVFAEDAPAAGQVEVQQCPKCAYTVADKCPMCGTVMEKKSMTAADAQAAIDKTKEMMRRRS